MLAVVEYVLSGHRLKLYIPKEGVSIVFAPSGIKTPGRAMAAGNGKPAQVAEPFADDAVAFTKECMMQVGSMHQGVHGAGRGHAPRSAWCRWGACT